jgi:hypothetical protein
MNDLLYLGFTGLFFALPMDSSQSVSGSWRTNRERVVYHHRRYHADPFRLSRPGTA